VNVLLRSRIPGLGDRGDIVRVADGYARNYLIPRKLAVVATPKIEQQAVAMRQKAEAQRARERAEAEERARLLAGLRLEISARASDEGTLFGSVGTSDIVSAVQAATGIELDRAQVRLEAPLKHVGEHPVVLALGHGVDVAIAVVVTPAEH
jgi:large subunit ribosomal protein L9